MCELVDTAKAERLEGVGLSLSTTVLISCRGVTQ